MQSRVSWCTCSGHPLNMLLGYIISLQAFDSPQKLFMSLKAKGSHSDRSIDKVTFIMNKVQLIFLMLRI